MRTALLASLAVLASAAAATASATGLPFATIPSAAPTPAGAHVLLREMARLPASREYRIRYLAHGVWEPAIVLAPRVPRHPLPLVLALHGRGGDGAHACAVWGDLAGYAQVVIVCPHGRGRLLDRDSWGAPQQIEDLAQLPATVAQALPQLPLAPGRVYAIGASMGGQEALLLAGTHPGLLRGVVAVDPVTNLSARYVDLARARGGTLLQARMAAEVGGTPQDAPLAYEERSPIAYINQLARGRTAIHVWWSSHDWIVRSQEFAQTGAFVRALAQQHPVARVTQRYGTWSHSWPYLHTPWALLGELGLLSQRGLPQAPGAELALDQAPRPPAQSPKIAP